MNIFYITAIAIGILISFFSQTREFYYLAGLFVIAGLFFSFKKRKVQIIDLLLLVIATIPFHTFRFGGEVDFIRLSEIAFVPLLGGWLLNRIWGKEIRSLKLRKELILVGLYIIINIASTTNSLYPLISIKRIAILCYLFLFTYLVTDILTDKAHFNRIFKAMVLISGFSAIIAALQSVFPQLLLFGKVPIGTFLGITFYRAGVGWHDPNYYALYLGLSAAITFSFILAQPKKNMALFKICFALQVIGICATFSRTILGSVILVCVYLLYRYNKKRAAAAIALSLFLLTLAVATAMPVIYKKYPFMAAIVYRIPEKETLKDEPVLIMGHRYAAFKANWAMFLDHPALGVGPFMAMYNFSKYRPSGYNYALSNLASHNQYLQLLSEKGILGFLLFMGFIFIIVYKLGSYSKKTRDSDCKMYLLGLKAAILVYLIACFSLETSYELQFWFIAGISLALFNLIEKENLDAS